MKKYQFNEITTTHKRAARTCCWEEDVD